MCFARCTINGMMAHKVAKVRKSRYPDISMGNMQVSRHPICVKE